MRKEKEKVVYHNRQFVNKPGFHGMGNIMTHIIHHLDDKNEVTWTDIEFNIADCSRQIRFVIDVDTKEERENSLYKVDKFLEVISDFKKALKKEVKRKEVEEKKKNKGSE